jgi:pimeloyl-ACP methyl ester carboxylesterase
VTFPRPADRFVELAGGRFHYRDWGDPAAPALILLHGFNQTGHSWDELATRAGAEGFRAVALDQRGHGDSDHARGGDYGREAMADDPARLADALGIDRFAAVGMSMGAVHALLCAVRHAARVRALVVVDWAPEVEASGVDAIAGVARLGWASFDEAVAAMRAFNPRRSEENIRARLAHSLARGEDGVWRWKVDVAGLGTHPRFREPPETMWREIVRVACPALVVRGEESPLLSAETAERLAATLPDGRLSTVAGAGHSVPGDNPEGFYRAVMPFLREHARAG